MTLPPIERIRSRFGRLAWPGDSPSDSIRSWDSRRCLMVGRLGVKQYGAVGLATQFLRSAAGTRRSAPALSRWRRYIGANDRDSAEEVLKQSVVSEF